MQRKSDVFRVAGVIIWKCRYDKLVDDLNRRHGGLNADSEKIDLVTNHKLPN